jgi:hypothetical protein
MKNPIPASIRFLQNFPGLCQRAAIDIGRIDIDKAVIAAVGTFLIVGSAVCAAGLVYLSGYCLNDLRERGEDLRAQPRASITQPPSCQP